MPASDTVTAAIAALPPLREIISRYGLAARKGLGQHFLLDLNLTARIARAANDIAGATVIEVGPGPGGLTRALLAAGAGQVVAIEKDPRCLDALGSLVAASEERLTLVPGDALTIGEQALLAAEGASPGPVWIIANLPYNVATVLIIKWLRQIAATSTRYAGLVLLLQKEVADRLIARPRTKAYGRLSVMCQWLCDTVPCFDIGARAFTPPPKVDSTVVRLTPLAKPRAPAAWDDMEMVTRAAFGQRRKMLRASLRTIAGANAEVLLAAADIRAEARAEELPVEVFATLASAYGNRMGSTT